MGARMKYVHTPMHTCHHGESGEKKKKDQSRAQGLSLEALQPGDKVVVAAKAAAAAVVSRLP